MTNLRGFLRNLAMRFVGELKENTARHAP